jgi:hypothetical protein
MRKILIYASSRRFRIEEPVVHAGCSVINIPENDRMIAYKREMEDMMRDVEN